MQGNHCHTETELLIGIAESSQSAFRELFERYQQRVYAYALHFLRSDALAREVVVDVFAQIWRRRAAITAIAKLESYLFITARNISFNLLKKEAMEGAARKIYAQHAEDQIEIADQALERHEFSQSLDQAIALLSPRQRKIYLMSRVDGLSHQEIARRLDISPRTVNAHITQALRYLRARLTGRP